jgi:hypothetical protein
MMPLRPPPSDDPNDGDDSGSTCGDNTSGIDPLLLSSRGEPATVSPQQSSRTNRRRIVASSVVVGESR